MNFNKEARKQNLNKFLKHLGTNRSFMKSIIRFADKGINI